MPKKNYDFGGYSTKVGLKCTDGRTIMHDAFLEDDGKTVPLVWQHFHNDPKNILGHAILENRSDGVYAYCSLNDTENAKAARSAIKHGDIKALSIYANSLVQKGLSVIHGAIREVSLVIAGANPMAYIDNIAFEHSDGSVVEADDEARICANDPISIPLDEETVVSHAGMDTDTETAGDVFNTLTEKQQTVVIGMIAAALEEANPTDNTAQHSNVEGDNEMKKNLFDKGASEVTERTALSHSDLELIISEAKRCGSLKEAFLAHADYGIENVDFLFPDARNVTPTPAFIKRDTNWVQDVFGAAHKTPFSRIKTLAADITGEEARARGYIKGKQKVDEVISLLKRTTAPTTIYKKQRLDRDDIVDITDLDVVAWLKLEMRMMLEEEIARSILISDGRSPASDDKINEMSIRPIYKDEDLFSVKVQVPENTTTSQLIDQMILSRKLYKGSGIPVLFATADVIGDMLLLKDSTMRRLYNTINDLAAALRVSKIVEVPVMEGVTRQLDDGSTAELMAIEVNMQDYYVGADRGGAVNMFDDFDIDYNQYKYLIETRCSGALVLPHSALVFEKVTAATP